MSSDPYEFAVDQYKGVPIYHNRFDRAPCVHIRLVVRVGAAHDPVGCEGLSHFLEHLPFEGSASYPNSEAVDQFSLDYLLGSFNAATDFYSTTFEARFLPKHASKAIAGIGDILFRPSLDEKDVEHEREVILEEAWSTLRHEKWIAFRKRFRRNVFANHPLARSESPFGWPDTVAAIPGNLLREWHRKQYTRGNLAIVLGGALEPAHVGYLHDLIEAVPDGTRATGPTPISRWPAPKEQRTEYSWAEIDGAPMRQAHFVRFRILASDHHTDSLSRTTMAALERVLMRELRDRQALIYAIKVEKQTLPDLTLYQVAFECDEEKLPVAETAINQTVSRFVDGHCATEFERQRSIELELIQAQEHHSEDVLDSVVSDIVNHDRIVTDADRLEHIGSTTYEQAARLVADTFSSADGGVCVVKS